MCFLADLQSPWLHAQGKCCASIKGYLTARKEQNLWKVLLRFRLHNRKLKPKKCSLKMRAAVWATYYHSISTDEEHYHYRCPEGASSCCFLPASCGSHKDHPTHTLPSHELAKKMVPVYKRMSDQSLLTRMVHGCTQNTNECLNSQIWRRCPKTVFMGKRRMDGAVANAVGVFNEGATELVQLMNKL